MNWFKNLKIRSKLLICFLTIVFLTGVVGFLGITKLQQADESDTFLYENETVPIDQAGVISTAFQRQRSDLLQLLISKNVSFISDREGKIKDRDNEIDSKMPEFAKTLRSDVEKETFNRLTIDFADYKSIRAKAIELAKENKSDEGLALYNNELDKVRYKVQDDITVLVSQKRKKCK